MLFYEEKEVAVMSPGGRSQHLRWCHIRNKTERLSGGKRTVQDYTFSLFFEFLRKEVLNVNESLSHYGIKGMKWGVRRYQNPDGTLTSAGKKRYSDEDIIIEKGSEVHRIVPRSWSEREKKLSGHAYASYKKEDTERYRTFARMFGDGNNYVDMTFKAKDVIVSPSRKKRVDEFIKLIDSDPEVKKAMIKATRTPLLFMPKRRLDQLDDPKKAEKAYEKFSFLLASKRELRDPYFKRLEDAGYSMIIDDADVRGGISKAPIIIFDRNKSMSLESIKTLNGEKL